MKTKVLKYNLVGRSQVFVVSLLALLRKTGLAGEETSGAIPAEVLDTLKIQLVSPNVTGAQILTTKLTRPCHYSVEGNELTIALGELTPGQHRLTVKSVYGTNTRSLLIIDATVPVGAGETGEAISVDVAAVSTVSDENNADGRVFHVDDEGNAKILGNNLSIGGGTATGENAVAEGESTTASGDRSHAEGLETIAAGENSHAEGSASWGDPYEVTVRPLTVQEKEEIAAKVGNVHPDYICDGDEIKDGQAPVLYADEECTEMVARIRWSKHSDNWHDDLNGDFFQIMSGTLAAGTYWARFEPAASGNQSHAEGESTTASGDRSHAEGENTTASGDRSHAEGNSTTASGHQSHAEGDSTTASAYASHAEGNSTTASGFASHAEGDSTTASGDQSHAEGDSTTASGDRSHAEGDSTTASGDRSHAEGYGTKAASDNQHVSGKYNVEDSDGDYALIVGNGTGNNARSNAFAIDWNGNLVLFNNGTPVVLTPAKLAQLIA